MMGKQNRSGVHVNIVAAGLLVVGALFLCLLVGMMAAVMAPGVVVRLVAGPAAVMGLIGLWVMPKRRDAPDDLLNGMLLLLLVLINLWPTYVIYRFGGLPSINPTKLTWLAFLLLATFSILSCQQPMARLTARCRAHPVLISSALFLCAWRVISSATGIEPVGQVLSLASEIISCYLIFFIALAVLRDQRDVSRLLVALVAIAIVQASLASYEAAVKHTLFDRFLVLSAEDSAIMLDTLREKFRDGNYRAQGTFEHPMVLAEFMAMLAPVAAAVFLMRTTLLVRWISVAFIPMAFVVILSSRSRVGIAMLLAAVMMVGALMLLPRGRNVGQHKANLTLVTAALLLPLLLVGGYFAMQEMMSLIAGRSHGEANSTLSRVLMLERGVPLLQASPFFGYGNGMGAVKLGFFDGVRFNIDNYWLGLALDSGVPGLTGFLLVFLGAIWLGLRTYKRRTDNAGTAAGLMAISLLILLGCKTVLSISSGLTLGYILIAAIIVMADAPGSAGDADHLGVKR